MNRFIVAAVFGFFAVLAGTSSASEFLHAPHSSVNNIGCQDCHRFPFNEWQDYVPDLSDPDDTLKNFICLRCHGAGGGASFNLTHSANLTTSTYGMWSTQCVDCHDPHFHAQLQTISSAPSSLYLVTGVIGKVTINQDATSTIDYSGSPLKVNAPAWKNPDTWSTKTTAGNGLILVVNAQEPNGTFKIRSADNSTITVSGKVKEAACGLEFGIIYGQFIRENIRLPNGEKHAVRFFDSQGGFTETNKGSSPEGICQVCHTKTRYWTSDGANTNHYNGVRCTFCHLHHLGFNSEESNRHADFITGRNECTACHADTDMVLGIHKNQCEHCHTNPPALALAVNRKNVIAIKRGGCLTCHDSAKNHGTTNATAASIHDKSSTDSNCGNCHLGNTSEQRLALHGDCVTCHSSTKSAVTNSISAGRAGSIVKCTFCHSGGIGSAKRHGDIIIEPYSHRFQTSSACSICHSSSTAAQRLALHPSCITCHSSSRNAVKAAISAGKAGTVVACSSCHAGGADSAHTHGITNATAAYFHDEFSNNSTCASCHLGNTSEQRLTLHGDCVTCHGSTKSGVTKSILAGRAGTMVTCTSCHAAGSGYAATHGNTK